MCGIATLQPHLNQLQVQNWQSRNLQLTLLYHMAFAPRTAAKSAETAASVAHVFQALQRFQ